LSKLIFAITLIMPTIIGYTHRMEHQEIEVRFLEIDKEALIAKLERLGAEDLGEDLLEEKIIYDKDLSWANGLGKFLRLRTQKGKTILAYKHHKGQAIGDVEEIEFEVRNAESAELLLERLGFPAFRQQQKKRHTFHFGEVIVDIDTWPQIPTYVELEGPSEDSLKEAALKLELDWQKVELRSPRKVIEQVYNIPVGNMKWFTFNRFE
jgi:adenylate cyclase class 2